MGVVLIVMIYAKAFLVRWGWYSKISYILCFCSKDLGSMAKEVSIEQYRCICRGASQMFFIQKV